MAQSDLKETYAPQSIATIGLVAKILRLIFDAKNNHTLKKRILYQKPKITAKIMHVVELYAGLLEDQTIQYNRLVRYKNGDGLRAAHDAESALTSLQVAHTMNGRLHNTRPARHEADGELL